MTTFLHLVAVLCAITCFGNCQTASCCAEETPAEVPVIASLLPADGTEVDVMGFPERFAELSKKLQAGIKENPGTLAVEVFNAKPGEPIAYNPRLGLTKEEFEEYLRLAAELKLVKVTSVRLGVRRSMDGVQLDGGDLLPELKKITINPEKKQVVTPFGTCTALTEVRADDGHRATGQWSGVKWKLEKLFPPTEVTVMLGRLEESGRGLLVYRAKGFEGVKPKSVAYMLNFDLEPAK